MTILAPESTCWGEIISFHSAILNIMTKSTAPKTKSPRKIYTKLWWVFVYKKRKLLRSYKVKPYPSPHYRGVFCRDFRISDSVVLKELSIFDGKVAPDNLATVGIEYWKRAKFVLLVDLDRLKIAKMPKYSTLSHRKDAVRTIVARMGR